MKYLYIAFLCLTFNVSNAQHGKAQLVLTDANIGTVLYGGCSECSNQSNDTGLNTIFINHNVTLYQDAYAYSGLSETMGRIHIVDCDNCDQNQLIQDLNNYNSVITLASLNGDFGYFNHGLSLKLIDDNIGIPTGESNGIIMTNNPELNQIFIDYNVSLYELVNIGTSFEKYELFCDCDAQQLKQELDALDSVISSSDYLFMSLLLSIDENELKTIKVHPNPFKNKVSITTNAQILQLAVYNVLGKEIFKTNSIKVLEDFSSSLSSGVYILKLLDSENRIITKKLIKQ